MPTHLLNSAWIQSLTRPSLLSFLLTSTLICCTGCDDTEPIVTYTVPTKLPAQLQAGKQRMLAAMVPSGDQVWFFKVMGPEDAIDVIDDQFRTFVADIQLSGGIPQLDQLPEGWKRGGQKMMRYASIDVDTPSKQLDISISKLGLLEDWDAMVAMNVNRWRGQLGLDSSDEKWAAAESMEVESADQTSVWVDLVGDTASNSMTPSQPPFARGAAPFAGGQTSPMPLPGSPAGPPETATADAPAEPMTPDPRLKFDRPEGWRDGRMSSMRMAAFNVGPEDAAAEITIIPAGGDLRGNVARWLGQVRGGAAPDDVVDQAMDEAQTVDVDGREGKRFYLAGGGESEKAIDATIVPMESGMSLFIKMTGPEGTVADQTDQIAAFLKSLKLDI